MTAYDPRLTPARADLAAKALAGKVDAKRYVEGHVREIVEPQAPLRREPAPDAPLATEALMGERVTVYDENAEGWAWGQLAADGYVGWLTATGGHVPAAHLAPIDVYETDFVAVAERFLGVPYLWGGKTTLGLDCSGLVQIALTACGIACPRDSDMQEQALGTAILGGLAAAEPRRGDLVFWDGHVAIVRDRLSLLHANAFHMSVAIEPIAEAVSRIRDSGSEIS